MASLNVEKSSRPNNLISAGTMKKNNIDMGYGLRTLAVLSAVYGQYLNVPPVNVRKFSAAYVINLFYTFSITIFFISFSLAAAYSVYVNSTDFSTAVYFASGFFGFTEATLRVLFLTFRKQKMEKVQGLFQKLINQTNFQQYQPEIIKRLSITVYTFLFTYMAIYVIGITGNILSTDFKIDNIDLINENITSNNSENVHVEVIELWFYINIVSRYCPAMSVTTFIVMVYVISFLGIGKTIVSNLLFYSWYWLVVEELGLLARQLDGVVRRSTSSCERMSSWLEFHHSVTRILHEVNKIASPVITIAVVFSALQICLVAFVAVKHILDLKNCLLLLLYGFMSLQQVFVYCILGQRIRDKVTRLHVSTYRSSWLGSKRSTQHAALMICSAATERGMALPGAPFFALSLEFFASVVGVAFTYFIVLLQVNNV